jgi:hypothetical protein
VSAESAIVATLLAPVDILIVSSAALPSGDVVGGLINQICLICLILLICYCACNSSFQISISAVVILAARLVF